MTPTRSKTSAKRGSFTSWHVAVAAEAMAAAQFARCGVDVSVQYGANQPEYDLMVADGKRVLKISVKGSVTGSWGLTQSYLKNADYHGAVDQWLARHKARTIFCFVQFSDAAFSEMPRLYLAHPREVAKRLKQTAAGRGDTILHERKEWGPRAQGAGTIDEVPKEWTFSPKRLKGLLTKYG
jgi:hypothetical protein